MLQNLHRFFFISLLAALSLSPSLPPKHQHRSKHLLLATLNLKAVVNASPGRKKKFSYARNPRINLKHQELPFNMNIAAIYFICRVKCSVGPKKKNEEP